MRIDDGARDDLVGVAGYYNRLTPGTGDRFLGVVYQLIDEIVLFPAAGTLVRPGLRQRLLPGFPYVVIYAVDLEEVVVIAVMHTSRRFGSRFERWEVREPAAVYLVAA